MAAWVSDPFRAKSVTTVSGERYNNGGSRVGTVHPLHDTTMQALQHPADDQGSKSASANLLEKRDCL